MSKPSDLKPSTLSGPRGRMARPADRWDRSSDRHLGSLRTRARRQLPAVGGPTPGITTRPTNRPKRCWHRLEGGAEALLCSARAWRRRPRCLTPLAVGSHVVAPRDMYWTIRVWLEERAGDGRLSLDLVPTGDLDVLRATVRPGVTKVVWVETPSNPTCAVTDIAGAPQIAHAAGASLVVDGTVATPVLCQPLALGADLVMHSATKQLNGHSDVLAGALVTNSDDEMWQRIKHDRAYRGSVLGPFEAWLLLRGMRTLYLRVAKASENAQRVAEALADESRVREVLYPGLANQSRSRRGTAGRCTADTVRWCRFGSGASRRLVAWWARSGCFATPPRSAASKASPSTGPRWKARAARLRAISFVCRSASRMSPI